MPLQISLMYLKGEQIMAEGEYRVVVCIGMKNGGGGGGLGRISAYRVAWRVGRVV
jgi:hypothetical protein